jgi:hypothetical protein
MVLMALMKASQPCSWSSCLGWPLAFVWNSGPPQRAQRISLKVLRRAPGGTGPGQEYVMITPPPPFGNPDAEHRGWITALDQIGDLAVARPVRRGAGLGSRVPVIVDNFVGYF